MRPEEGDIGEARSICSWKVWAIAAPDLSYAIVCLDVESAFMPSHVLIHLPKISLQNQSTRLAYVVFTPGASIEEFMTVEASLGTQVAAWRAVVLNHFP